MAASQLKGGEWEIVCCFKCAGSRRFAAYTGQNEVLFDQPVILNSIEDLVTRSPVNTFDLRFVHTK